MSKNAVLWRKRHRGSVSAALTDRQLQFCNAEPVPALERGGDARNGRVFSRLRGRFLWPVARAVRALAAMTAFLYLLDGGIADAVVAPVRYYGANATGPGARFAAHRGRGYSGHGGMGSGPKRRTVKFVRCKRFR
jgi:hypothetical protein